MRLSTHVRAQPKWASQLISQRKAIQLSCQLLHPGSPSIVTFFLNRIIHKLSRTYCTCACTPHVSAQLFLYMSCYVKRNISIIITAYYLIETACRLPSWLSWQNRCQTSISKFSEICIKIVELSAFKTAMKTNAFETVNYKIMLTIVSYYNNELCNYAVFSVVFSIYRLLLDY